MELDALCVYLKCLFLLTRHVSIWQKISCCGCNLIGQRATIHFNVCGYMWRWTRRPVFGSYNIEHLTAFLNELEQPCQGEYITLYRVGQCLFPPWELVREWFQAHPKLMTRCLPPYSPVLNPISEFISTWRWKVYDHHPHEHVTFLQAMDEVCNDKNTKQCQAWICHARRFTTSKQQCSHYV